MFSSTWRDLQWLWLFSWPWVWGFLPFQASLSYPLGDLRVDHTQLFFTESPNRIAWHLMPWTIRFTFFVLVSMDGILAPSFLPHRTSPASAALAIYWTMIKHCVACSCVDIRCLLCCCFYFSVVVYFFVGFVAVAPLVVGFCTMTYVIFAPLYVGLLWALLYNHLGFLPSWLIGSLSSC
jgi:hypothetical protein